VSLKGDNGATVADYTEILHPHRSRATFGNPTVRAHTTRALSEKGRMLTPLGQSVFILHYIITLALDLVKCFLKFSVNGNLQFVGAPRCCLMEVLLELFQKLVGAAAIGGRPPQRAKYPYR
jgi:hypothetical protein